MFDNVIDATFVHLGIDRATINVDFHIVATRAIKRLNALHRDENRPTDVLSFPNLELAPGQIPTHAEFPLDINPETGRLELGTVFICERVAKKQAKRLGHTTKKEILFLALHGLLHLLGYTHEDQESEEKMCELQQIIRRKYEQAID